MTQLDFSIIVTCLSVVAFSAAVEGASPFVSS